MSFTTEKEIQDLIEHLLQYSWPVGEITVQLACRGDYSTIIDLIFFQVDLEMSFTTQRNTRFNRTFTTVQLVCRGNNSSAGL